MSKYNEDQQEHAIKQIARKLMPLEEMVILTNALKALKAKGIPAPSYEIYSSYCNLAKTVPPAEAAYHFAARNVYRQKPLISMGQPWQIWMLEEGEVEARFIKNFGNVNLFLRNDDLVMTCPTFIQLVEGDIKEIFSFLFKPAKAA